MPKNKWIMIFEDDKIHFCYLEHKYIFQNSICLGYGKVIHPKQFIIEMNLFFKKHHLKRSVFGDSTFLIHNPFWTETDKTIATSAFNFLGFKTIDFINEVSLYDKKQNSLWITCYPSYITYSYLEKNDHRIILIYDKAWKKDLIFQLKKITKQYPVIQTIYLFKGPHQGLEEEIESIIKLKTYVIKSKIDYYIINLKK